jgi:hypothetical protein
MNMPDLEKPMTTMERHASITRKFAAGYRPDNDTFTYAAKVFDGTMNAVEVLLKSGKLQLAEINSETAEVDFHTSLDDGIPEQLHEMLCFLSTCMAMGRTDASSPMEDAKAITKAMADPTGESLNNLVAEREKVAYDHVIRGRRIVTDDGARDMSDILDDEGEE